jgi:peptidoglycan/xylan/chitin deacetylase (PgdA/CDA1 family)
MPWKDRYTVCDEKSLVDDDVSWPSKQQIAVRVVVDYSVDAVGDGIGHTDINRSVIAHARGVQVWRLLDLFDKYGVRATFAVPAIMAEAFGDNVREASQRGHEIAAHGYLHEDVSKLDRQEEERRLRLTTDLLEDVAGNRPVGWFSLPTRNDPDGCGYLSSNTMALLDEAGYSYFGNGLADDIPYYWIYDYETRKNVLTLPYYYHFDDQWFISFPGVGAAVGSENPAALYTNWRREFDASYRRGRCFSMVIHPYLIQCTYGLEVLERFFIHMTAFPGIWCATGAEIADHWQATYPAATHLNLTESIWQDYSGSLS